jgi:hypothetical protein
MHEISIIKQKCITLVSLYLYTMMHDQQNIKYAEKLSQNMLTDYCWDLSEEVSIASYE